MGTAVSGAEAVGKQEPLIYHRNLLEQRTGYHRSDCDFAPQTKSFVQKCARLHRLPRLRARLGHLPGARVGMARQRYTASL